VTDPTPVRSGGGGGGGTDIKALVKDKRFLAAAGVVVVVGLVALLRKRGEGGAGGIGGGTVPVGSSGYVQGGADTTGTDVASFLSQYSAAQLAYMDQWGKALQSTLDSIKNNGGDIDDPPTNGGTTLATVSKFWDESPGAAGGDYKSLWSDQQFLKWNKAAGATGYKIRDLVSGRSWTVGDTDSLWFDGLVRLGSYHYGITPVFAGGQLGTETKLYNTHTGG